MAKPGALSLSSGRAVSAEMDRNAAMLVAEDRDEFEPSAECSQSVPTPTPGATSASGARSPQCLTVQFRLELLTQ